MEKLIMYAASLSRRKKLGLMLVVIMAPVLAFAWDHMFRHGEGALAEKSGIMQMKGFVPDPEIATVGDSVEGAGSPGASWAGEILSLGNLPIQPQREGTLVEWKVRIGDRVREGDVLAKLSAPPLMPDLTRMLAEQASMLAEARAGAETTKVYAQKNNQQLANLLNAIGIATQDSQAILSGNSLALPTAKVAVEQAQKAADAMRQNIRSFLDQTIAAHLRTVSNAVTVSAFRAGSFNRMYGQIDPQNQYTYEAALLKLIEALRDPGAVPFEEAEQYFVSAVRLANTTVDSTDVMDIKPMMRMDQNEYLEMASKYREMEAEAAMKATEYKLMSVEQTKMYAQDRKMIDEQIA
ncbi:MAG: biotin/lipoyl-binding protein, partial [bacterium]|nr:biotin/lipoyl-binding protein [bacterium]